MKEGKISSKQKQKMSQQEIFLLCVKAQMNLGDTLHERNHNAGTTALIRNIPKIKLWEQKVDFIIGFGLIKQMNGFSF